MDDDRRREPNPGPSRLDRVWVGVLLLFLAHVVCQYGYLIAYTMVVKGDTLEKVVAILVPLIWIGASQLVYAVPLVVWLTWTQRLRARDVGFGSAWG